MSRSRRLQRALARGLAAVLLAAAAPRDGRAQVPGPLAGVATQVEVGEKVRVLRTDGSEIRGELDNVTPEFLIVDVNRHLTRIDATAVREIGVKDGVYDGILIGLGSGLLTGLVTGFVVTSPDDGNLRGLGITMTAAAGLVAGLAVGATLDARSAHYRRVYGNVPTVRMVPMAAPGQYGALVAIGW